MRISGRGGRAGDGLFFCVPARWAACKYIVKVANKKVKLQISSRIRKYLPKLANKLENSQISAWKFLVPVKKSSRKQIMP
ncbi:hypothetical protein B9K06_08190 [Bacillus sp. OG2]|nr:hypothetical protein B9K06_08190 [Bacillus sp. OG2]